MVPIETYYDGRLFRSRLEARWAVFFNVCGVNWEYETEGYDLGNNVWYLPDFVLHGVNFSKDGYSTGNDLWIEVKGKQTKEDADKVRAFAKEHPIMQVTEIPLGEKIQDLYSDIINRECKYNLSSFNFETVVGKKGNAFMGINLDGEFELFSDDSTGDYNSFLDMIDERATVKAYRRARCAQFSQYDRIVSKLHEAQL